MCHHRQTTSKILPIPTQLTSHDAKHSIFLSKKKGGYGLHSFTREYVSALLRDIEVYISNGDSLPAHALLASIDEATKQCLWTLFHAGKIPNTLACYNQIHQANIAPKRTLVYADTPNQPIEERTTFDHTHLMDHAIITTSALGFML
jgi:hypothetical protein